jgi:hypothetical protein
LTARGLRPKLPADVEADARDADLPFVSDHAADGLGIAEVAVGADDAGHGIADLHAVAHLRQRRGFVIAEHGQRAIAILLGLRRYPGCCGLGLGQDVLLASCLPKRTPHRQRSLARPVDFAVGVKAGRDGQLACALLVWVVALHGGPFCQPRRVVISRYLKRLLANLIEREIDDAR